MSIKQAAKKNQSSLGLLKAIGVADLGSLPRVRPMYRRLVELVERGLAAGTMTAGAQLPPERDLARALKVSRTLPERLVELVRDGLERLIPGEHKIPCLTGKN